MARDHPPELRRRLARRRLSAALLSEESFRPERLFFVVTETGRPVAAAGALKKLLHGDRTGYLHMLAVLPEFRGGGWGRRCCGGA